MFLVELVMQGVRGFRDLTRLRFQSGFNLIAGGNESGKTASVDALKRLLFPSSEPGPMAGLVSDAVPDASRAALVMSADDNGYYRVIQDLSKKAVNLSKYNPATKEFNLMHKTWEKAAEFMSGMTCGMGEADYEKVFIIRREAAVQAGAVKVNPAPRPVMHPEQRPSGVQDDRLKELREKLKKSEEAADADYRLQSARLKIEELEKKMRSLDEIDARVGDLETQLDTLKGCETLPDDLSELIEAHEQHQSKMMADSDELAREIEDLKFRLEAIPTPNIMKDPIFIVGAVLLVLSVIAGMFILEEKHDFLFPIGLLVSLGVIAFAWYRGAVVQSQRRVIMKEMEALEGDQKALEKSFTQGGAPIAACMQATGSRTLEELRERSDNYRYFLSLRSELKEQQERIYGGLSREELTNTLAKQKQEAVELEEAARALAHHAVDTYSLRQEIDRIESEAGEGASSWDAAPESLDSLQDEVVPSTGGFEPALEAGSRISGIEAGTFLAQSAEAAQRNLNDATGGRYIGIAIVQGESNVKTSEGAVLSLSKLSAGARELAAFCIRTGIAEAALGGRKIPVLLDDPLAGIDPARQKAACKILRGLGAKTQVLLFSSNPGLRVDGDAFTELR